MATVQDDGDVITQAGGVEEEAGAEGISPLPPVADNNNEQGDPPAYPGNNSSGGQGEWGQEMAVMGGPAPVVSEPAVTFIAKDETTDNWETSSYTYSLPLSSSVGLLYSTFAKEAGYVEGTFTLVWARSRSSDKDEEELYEKSDMTLMESGMEGGGKEQLYIRDKDGSQPKRENQLATGNNSAVSSSKVTTTTFNNSQSSVGGNYGNSSNYSNYGNTSSGSYGYSNYGYQSYSYKSDTGFVGLVNQAMTCYLNSLLQTLFMTPEFRNALYQWRFPRGNGDEGAKSIPYQLQRLFIHLQTSEKRAIETTDVTKSFGWDSSEAWQQHDVQELCRVMFDALERRFKKDKHDEADLINYLYQGTLKDYVKCLECDYESAREDHFLDIPLVIKPFGANKAYGSVEEGMQAFVDPETLTGDNQYKCEQCQAKCDAHKGLKFKSFPYLLTLQLKRFDFDYSTMHRIKLNDRMTFPRILDLNSFILQEDMPAVPEGVEERYRDFVVEEFDVRPPPYNYSRSSNAHSYSNAVTSSYSVDRHPESSHTSHDDPSSQQTTADINNETNAVADSNNAENTVADGNNRDGDDTTQREGEEPVASGNLTVGQRLKRGPYVYELFSIMIHSGSAIGGHYYAYIKSFSDKRWYCFNDQSVSKLNEEDIEGTFGGTDSRSRGYYSSMYQSSANAYMLMYRRINKEANKDFIPLEKLPKHVLEQIEEDRRRQEEKRRMEEYDRSLCKFRLFTRHLVTNEAIERRIEVRQDWTLQDTIAEAHKLLDMNDVAPVSRCRLVKYDEYTECLDQSFEEPESGETFSQMVGGPRNYYSFELFLEIRRENEVFKPYNRGGLNLKVLVVDVAGGEVAMPVPVRAEQSWTVLELKEAISERFSLSVECMRVALETYQNEGRLISNDSHLLKNESFFRKHTVFACGDADDFERPYRESEMCKLIDVHVNSISLTVTIPPPPPPQRRPDAPLTSQAGLPEGGQGGGGAEGVESSVDKPEGAVSEGATGSGETPPAAEDTEKDKGQTTPPPEPEVDMTKERPLQRTIDIRIDRRRTLQDLKDRLVEYVQQPATNFKVYRLYSNNQEYEMSRLNDHLTTVPNDTRLVVRLGRALQPGEVRVRLSLLRMDQTEFFKPLMDSIVTKGMTVLEFKKQFIQEAYNQGIEYPLQLDRIRLRKKTWKTASTVYLDSQVFEKDIHVFANFEIYVEPLSGPEPMSSPSQMQVYLRRWRPASYTVDTPHEIILDENNPAHLRKRIAEASKIPVEHVMFAKAHSSFPCELSVLDLEDDLEWNPNVSSISSMPLSIYDDGAVLYYKDAREKVMDLTAEKRSEIQKKERLKSNTTQSSHPTYHRYHAKEKALKIYTGEDEEDDDTVET